MKTLEEDVGRLLIRQEMGASFVLGGLDSPTLVSSLGDELQQWYSLIAGWCQDGPGWMERPTRRWRRPMTASSLSLSLAVTAIVISVLSLAISWRTFSLNHRPFIGLTAMDAKTANTPPTELSWTFLLKNTGALPAAGKLEVCRQTITRNGTDIVTPGPHPLNTFFIMPGDQSRIFGRITNQPIQTLIQEVLSAQTQLVIDLRITYRPCSGTWFSPKYEYAAKVQFNPVSNPLGFTILSVEAN